MRQELHEWKRSIAITARGTVALAAQLLFLAVFLAPLAVVGWQCLFWLRRGEWMPITLYDGLAHMNWAPPPLPQDSWVGVTKIVNAIYDIPLSVSVFFGVMLLIGAFGMLYVAWERQQGR